MFFYCQLWNHAEYNRLYFGIALDFKPVIFAFIAASNLEGKSYKNYFFTSVNLFRSIKLTHLFFAIIMILILQNFQILME